MSSDINLPVPGQDPWGDQLNLSVEVVNEDLQGTKGTVGSHTQQIAGLQSADLGFDQRLSSVEAGGGGGGGGVDSGLSGSWFLNKRWYACGTSITADFSYASKLAGISGMSLNNKGASGGTLSTASNGTIWNALTTGVAADAEVITIETINDFRLNVPLGAITDAENPATSYYGAMRAACNWILTNRPGARAFFFTAYGDAYAGGYPNGKTQNSLGKYYWEYNEAMEKVCRVYGIPVVKVGEESGINFYTCPYFTTDMIHMNALGGQRYAEFVWSRIRLLGWLSSRPTVPSQPAAVAVVSIKINQTPFAIGVGGTQQCSVTFTPGNATNKGVSWASSAPGVATVSQDGLVTGVTLGTSTITVTSADGNKTDAVVCTVQAVPAASIDVQPPSWTGLVGNTVQLTGTVLPVGAGNKTVSWASSNTGVATVNSNGFVTAVALGTATITATTQDGGFVDTTVITVASSIPATGIDLTPPSVVLGVGSTAQLTAAVLPGNATNKNVVYGSNAPSIATVNASGLVTGVSLGNTVITATSQDGGFTDTTTVLVGGEWVLSPQTSFRECNLVGLTAAGSNPSYTNVQVGTYGGVIVNSPSDTAIEFTVPDGTKGLWLIFGSQVGDDTTFVGMGDMKSEITVRAYFLNGQVFNIGAPIPAWSPQGYGTNKVYRVGRSGDIVKVSRMDGTAETVLWQGSLSNNYSGHASKYGQVDLGVLATAGAGSLYMLPTNCKTGSWTPQS